MIYVLRSSSGAIKIGYSRDNKSIERRIRTLQTAHPFPLTCISMFEGGRIEEAWLHSYFSERRLEGEWFDADEGVLDFLLLAGRLGLPRCMECKQLASKADPLWDCVGFGCSRYMHADCTPHIEEYETGSDHYCHDCFVEEFTCPGCFQFTEDCSCPVDHDPDEVADKPQEMPAQRTLFEVEP